MSSKIIKNNIKKLPKSKYLIVDDYPGLNKHKIGLEPSNRYISVLINSVNKNSEVFNPGGGKFLTIQYDMICSIKSKSKGIEKNKLFSILTLKSKDEEIEDYFIDLCEIFIKKLGNNPTILEVKTQFEKLESIFTKLSKITDKSIIGLWGELFLISISNKPEYLITSWHKDAKDKIDFNDGIDKIEVKTSSKVNSRKHYFGIEQLAIYNNSKTYIGSIITTNIDNGYSINDILKKIKSKVKPTFYEMLIEKTFDVVGDKINEINFTKYDYNMASSELLFFHGSDILKPELIPNGVSELKFKSDLDFVKPILKKEYKGILFRCF
jgi:hypothetical protein